MSEDHTDEERAVPEETPASESDLVEILDLPAWVGVAVGVILVVIAVLAVWLSK